MNPFIIKIQNPETKIVHEVKCVQYIPEKGKGKGFPKIIPEGFTSWTIERYIELFGSRLRDAIVIPKIKQVIAALSAEVLTKINEKGEEVPETDELKIQAEYGDLFPNLSGRGTPLGDITDRIEELQVEEIPSAIMESRFQDAERLVKELNALREAYATKKAKKQAAAKEPVAA